jgi:hypothetical protein
MSKGFTLYLQLKMFYKNYDHYYNVTTFGMSPKPQKEEKWKTATSGFFNAQYKSTLAGEYEGQYQLIRMQTVLQKMDHSGSGVVGGGVSTPLPVACGAYNCIENPR